MRILANYGRRNNGDSYNVTFEQMGDVPMERAEDTIDMLFKLAREAVQRQVDGEMKFPPKEKEVTIPRVATSNGNGNAGDATDKQKNFLRKLHADQKRGVNIDSLSKMDASQLIEELMKVS